MRTRHGLHIACIVSLQLFLGSCALLGGPKRIAPESYDLEFDGRVSFSTRRLTRACLEDLNDFVRDGYRKSAIDDAAYAIERFYRDSGFPFATVDYDYEVDALPLARFRITEGPRTELDRVDIEGHAEFPREELEALFFSPPGGLMGSNTTWYVQGDVASAVGTIASLYVSRGYLDVVVAKPTLTFDEAREHVSVEIVIDEGPRYAVGTIEFSGELVYTQEELLERAGFAAGDEYFPRLPYEVRGRLSDLYANRGHADVAVEVRRTIDVVNAVVDLAYEIVPGPLVTLAAIEVTGNEKTRESFVLSRLDVGPGSRYARNALRDGASRLYETGLFSRVDLSAPAGDGEPSDRTLLVELKENAAQEVYVTPGWGSYEKARLTAGIRGRNFFGTGRSAKAEATVSTKSLTGTLTLTDHWFLRSPYTADLSLFGNRREEPAFTRLENGATLSFSRKWTRDLRTVAGYEYRRSDAVDVEPTAEELDEDVQLSTLFFAPTYDTRDSFLAATRGSRSTFGAEWATSALGSQLDFLRFRAGRSQYFPLREGTVLAVRAQTGLIFPIGDTDTVPIQERFFNGGEDSVRSFREDELGPRDANGNFTGGEAFTLFSAEMRQRIAGVFGAAVFYDVGNVAPETENYFDFDDMRSGVGAGLRYMLPIGPLRVDGAWNPTARTDEDDWVVHFAVGMAF
jgi:outer membrane protein insertion porin family